MNNQNNQTKELNLWAIYGICLLISTIFFFLFGFNSPIYIFNPDKDYHWYMVMGNALVNSKIPYRDLFEQKGPIVYFVTAFCCLFSNSGIVMLIIEILSMSLFFFFAYRICKKRLNTFWSLVAIPLLALAIFTGVHSKIGRAGNIEEFCLPICSYILLCYIEFLTENKNWNWVRSLYLGLCFGIMLWSKYVLLYFALVPMIIWFILSLRRRQYRTLIISIMCMLAGILIITAPNLIFYAAHNALDDLFHVYFYINIFAYRPSSSLSGFLLTFINGYNSFLHIGAIILFFIFLGIIGFTVHYWHNHGPLLLIAFSINLLLLTHHTPDNNGSYYFIQLFPYAILGVIVILNYLANKITSKANYTLKPKYIFILVCTLSLFLCFPHRTPLYEFYLDKDDYPQFAIANVIHDFEKTHNSKATLLCYRLCDPTFYSVAEIVPNDYFYVQNVFTEADFPQMYKSFDEQISKQSIDFVITEITTYVENYDFISQYYQPYTDDINTSTYKLREFNDIGTTNIILLFKK